MKTTHLAFFAAVALISCSQAFAATPSPEALLKKADSARGGIGEGATWNLQLHSMQDGTASDVTYEVKVKGVDVLAKCTAPARQKDEEYLFNDRNLWVFRPGLRKPISVSPRQRLNGQAANGDIATTNYARDYSGKVVATEKVGSVSAYKLALKAKTPNVTYDSINYWISVDKGVGIKAEFMTLEGKVFKTATFEYQNSIDVAGKKAPFVSKMIITDAVFKNNVTTLTYDKPKSAALSDSAFNVNNLAR